MAAERQLRLLGEIAEGLDEAGVPVWLRGGWALEFLLGRVTRDHADVDLVAWREDRDAIHAALASRGFEHVRELPEVALDFEKAGESIQVLLVERSASGALVCRGFESWPFPEGSLDGPLCRIGDVACRTLAPTRSCTRRRPTRRTEAGRRARRTTSPSACSVGSRAKTAWRNDRSPARPRRRRPSRRRRQPFRRSRSGRRQR